MKRYNSMIRENSAGAQRKALAWMISIMLVVTGILPSFASNNKVTGAGDTKSTPSASKTVRAPKMCTVRFSALGADNVPAAVKVPKGEKLGSNYPKEIPTKNGYKFIGWTDGVFSMNEPNVDENYVINENKTFYAVWRTIIRVTFDAGGGTGNMETAEIAKGSDYELPECGFTPPSGKEFHKWSVSFGGKAPVEKAAREKIVVNADTVVKALWKDTESGFNLNASGNVKAKLENNKDLNIAAKDPTKDVKIDREKWNDMVKALGGKIDNSGDPSWGQSLVTGNIKVDSEVYLPQNSRHMFHAFKGNLLGADKFNTSEVTDMSGIFNYAKSVDADVSKWNVSNVTKMTGMFDGATSAKPDVSKWNTSKVTDMVSMFFGAKSANPDVSKWDVSNVTNVINMFYGATSAKPDVSKWGTSKITKMNWMFYGATLANPDVSKWDTSKVTDMAKMFYGATSAKPDTSKWDVSNVTDMSGMFYGATSANPDVSKWNTSKVTNMWGVFYGAKSATPDVSKWDTSKVTNMNSLFEGASAANPDASKWNTSNVTDMSFVFKNSGIKRIDFTKWNIDKVEESDKMFDGCANLEFVKTPSGFKTDISGAKDDFRIVKFKKDSAASVEKDSQNLNDKYEINKDGDKDAIYHIYKKNKYVGVTFDKNGGDKEAWMNHEITEKGKSIKDSNGNMPAENPTKKDNKFLGWSKYKTASASDFNEDTAVNEDITVYALWKKPQISDFDLNASGNVKAKLENNKNINIAVLDTSKDMKIDRTKWQDMVKALGGTINGNDIDWENAAVKDMHFKTDGIKLPSDSSKLFSNFKEVIRGSEKLNTDDVVNMASMFSGAKQATPDVLHWNTSGVTNMKDMFNGAKCAIPDVDDWDVSKVTDMQYMFKNTSISRVRLSKWKLNSEILNNADKSIGMFTGCDELEYLKTPAGLRTTIGGTNKNFKIVKLKKGSPVEIEKESHNLKDEYEINKDGDSAAVYHIYEKSKYVGVIFDKNHADTEAWVNHAITFKGWSLGSGIGKLPAEEPVLANREFMGWAKTPDVLMPDFELFTKVESDMKVYATWRRTEFDLNASGNVKARLDGDKNLNITASDTSADMQIDRTKWKEVLKILGGQIEGIDGNNLSWRKADIKDINFQTQGIYLPQDCSSFFREVQTSVNGCENLNTSNVTDMNNMFYGAKKANPNTSNWDTSKVSNMKALFQFTDKANPNVTSWDTSKVTNARDMFRYATAAMPAVSNWDTSEVTDMGGMFDNATSANPDVSKWNVSKVTNMGGMFEGATSANPNVSEWNVSNAIFMIEMFRGATSASPDVSKWNVSNVIYMRQMFEGATSANPDVSKWNVSNVKDIERMFKESAVKKLNLSSWKLNQDLLNDNGKMQDIFKGCANIEYLKTPKGLKTDISGANADFKIVRLKKDSAPSIEQESQNLNDNYEINKDGDSSAIYHIYDKNKYAGVTFDKNDGDTESWVNHEIVEKSKAFSAGGGIMPAENPTYAGYVFLGWAKNNSATSPDFDENTVAEQDMKVYSVWRKSKVNVTFEANGGSGEMSAVQVEQGSDYVLPACGFTAPDGKEFEKWSVIAGGAAPVNKLPGETVVANTDIMIKAIWKDKKTDFPLNATGNVNAKLDSDKNLIITATDVSKDMKMDREKWKGMVKSLGGETGGNDINWENADVKDINFQTDDIYLPNDSSKFFFHFKERINGSDKLKTDDVVDMSGMFSGAKRVTPDVSKWNTSNVVNMKDMFNGAKYSIPDGDDWDVSKVTDMQNVFKNTNIKRVNISKWKLNPDIFNNPGKSTGMFSDCDKLEYLKTPAGLRTTIGGTNKDFKIVKLKKGSPAEIEKENHDFKDEYEINKDSDNEAMYHIYEKSKYAGVIFDKNGGDTDSWVNHAIVLKGWYFISSGGKLPEIKPELANRVFMGWAQTADALMPDFDIGTRVEKDMKVYAVWRKTEIDLNASGNVKIKMDAEQNVNIVADDTSADMKIDRTKWKEALKILGGKVDGFDGNRLSWRWANIKDINFQTKGIALPQDSSSLLKEVQTNINGCEKLDTSNVTDMSDMFYDVKQADPNTSTWDTSNVTNMFGMFRAATKANPDVSNWITSKVTDTRFMFGQATSATPNVSNWDVSSVIHMGGMFYKATSANPDVSRWNVSNVINMYYMFEGATSANLDVSNWDVSNVKNMKGMLQESAVKKLNLSSWKLNQDLLNDNSKMQDIFKGCTNVEYLKTPKGLKTDISGVNTDFKIVRLKKDSAPSIEQESQNLNDNYEINKDGDSSAIYHIYDKNKYAGVIFDKNGGDKEAWMNHEITEKGKSIKESNGALPTENPNKNDHKFLGWSTDKDAGKPNFDEETVVNSDVIAYAVLHKDTAFDLNASGNVKAKIDNDGNMTISAENPTGDINIDSAKWAEMVNALGGQNFAWSESFKGNVIIDSNVYLPQDCSYMFYNFKGKLIGADKFNTSKVTLMTAMFYLASSVNPDVLTWDTSNVTDMTIMFKNAAAANPDVSNWNTSKLSGAEQMFVYSAIKKADLSKWDVSALNNSDSMFFGCEGLEYLKTPKGFKTSVEKINKDFKVVKLKKGSEATVEHESKNLNSEFTINAEGDKEAAYNIYSKDTYVGVLFDKNDADTSAFRNHEITEKGKSLKDSKIGLPEVNPGRAGHKFLGWSKSKTATAPDFDESTVVDSDITAYAVWKKDTPPAPTKVTVTLDGNGGVLAGGASATIAVDKGSTVKEQLEAAVANNIFTKAGYRLIGFSKSKFAATADYDLDSPVYSDTTLYAVYEETHEVTTVTIKYTEVGMQDDEVIENVPLGKAIGDKLGGHERALDGHSFLGYSKVKGATKPDFFKNSIVTDNLVLYPVYKEIGSAEKVKVAFKLNDGTDGSLKTVEVNRYESLGDKMPTRDKVPAREGYIFTGWAKSKAARYPDFFRGTAVKGDMTVYAVWKSLYAEKLGQPELKVSAKAKGYELTIVPPKENLHTGFEIFRSEKKDFKPGKDNKIAIIDRNTLKYLDDKADNSKAYYYAVRAIDADGSYNGTKVTFIGKLSEAVLATPLPKDKGVTATVAGKGAVDLEFNKTIAAAKYKVTVTAPYDKKFKEQVKEIEAGKLVAVSGNKVKANVKGLPMGKFLAFKLEALEADNDKLVEYGNSFAFMLGAVEKLTAKMNKKSRVLHIKFNAMKGVSGYEAKIVIGGKVKTIKLKKGNKKLRDFIVGSFKLPKKKGNYTFTIRAFKKIGKLKYYGQTITKTFR